MRIEEYRTDVSDGAPPSSDGTEEASSRLWGLSAGSDFGMRVGRSVTVTARVAIRWARGDRDAWVTATTPDTEAGGEGRVKLTDDTSRSMYGLELGVRWTPLERLAVEGGWWYRNWSVDDGPATYDGPFLRFGVGF
jgi:opacity protein-like surface antigen